MDRRSIVQRGTRKIDQKKIDRKERSIRIYRDTDISVDEEIVGYAKVEGRSYRIHRGRRLQREQGIRVHHPEAVIEVLGEPERITFMIKGKRVEVEAAEGTRKS